MPCGVVLAHREYEAWFLAAIESLRGRRGVRIDAESHPNPENPRGAKEQLELRMHPRASYVETADQPAFSAQFSLEVAYRRSRSFRRLATSLGIWSSPWGMTSIHGRQRRGQRVPDANCHHETRPAPLCRRLLLTPAACLTRPTPRRCRSRG